VADAKMIVMYSPPTDIDKFESIYHDEHILAERWARRFGAAAPGSPVHGKQARAGSNAEWQAVSQEN
jgi:hypothetical protein